MLNQVKDYIDTASSETLLLGPITSEFYNIEWALCWQLFPKVHCLDSKRYFWLLLIAHCALWLADSQKNVDLVLLPIIGWMTNMLASNWLKLNFGYHWNCESCSHENLMARVKDWQPEYCQTKGQYKG